jgi:hypothetical protein
MVKAPYPFALELNNRDSQLTVSISASAVGARTRAGTDAVGFSTGNDTTIGSISTPSSLSDDAWVDLAAVYDPAGAAPQKRLYVDGTLKVSKTLTTNARRPSSTTCASSRPLTALEIADFATGL